MVLDGTQLLFTFRRVSSVGRRFFCSGLIGGGDAAAIPHRWWIPRHMVPVVCRPVGIVIVVGVTTNSRGVMESLPRSIKARGRLL